MRLAVTGADGFVGRHVVAEALKRGHDVVTIVRDPSQLSSQRNDTQSFVGDLVESWPDVGPVDVIIHLAGLAAVGPSFENPRSYLEMNTAMVTNLCESVLRGDRPSPRLVFASTAALYAPSTSAVSETSELALTSPYAVSKRCCENLIEYYASRGIDSVIVRPFNHIGPGQRTGFIVPDLFLSLTELSPGSPLRVGNLNTERDYTDVRDVAAAYLDLSEAPVLTRRVYNVASGVARSGHEVLEAICNAIGQSVPELEYTTANSRPSDNPSVVGNAASLRTELGWSPVFPFSQSVTDFVRQLAPLHE